MTTRTLTLATVGILAFWLIVCVALFWAQDSINYLALGERLNAGHQLYALGPGDRYVYTEPGRWSSPSLYPPIWGVLWQPLAALPGMIGLGLWMVVCTGIQATWLIQRLRSGHRPTIALIALLAPSIAVLLASGNVAGLFMVGMAEVWTLRDRPRSAGILVGTMAAIKLLPGVLILYFLVTRRWGAAAWAVGTGAVLTLIGVVVAGPDATWQYLTYVLPTTHLTPAYALDAPWLIALPTIALALTVVLRAQHRASFSAAIALWTFGMGAVGMATFAELAGASRPFADHFGTAAPRLMAKGGRADAVTVTARVVTAPSAVR